MTWTRDALVAAMPYNLPRTAEIGVNGEVVAFSAGVGILTALLTGLLPALRTSAVRPSGALNDADLRGSMHGRSHLSRVLVTTQVALAVTVVAAAWILGGSFARLLLKDPGFDPRNIALIEAQPPEGAKAAVMVDQVLSVLASTPGVVAAAGIDTPPFRGRSRYRVAVPGRPTQAKGEEPMLDVRKVTPGYFAALRIRVLEGRDFLEGDKAGAPEVVIVNRAAADLLWPGQPRLGQSLSFGHFKSAAVVGVVEDTEQSDLTTVPAPGLFVSNSQFYPDHLVYTVRTAGPAAATISTLEARVKEIGLEVTSSGTLDEEVLRSIHVPRFRALLFGLMGLLVMILTAVGVFGVTAHSVAQRRRELGIRLALGASGRQLVRLVTSQAAYPVVLGLGIGLLAAYNTNQLMAQFLYEMTPTDPAAMAIVSLGVLGLALVAAYLPARRTLQIDPVEVLREE